MNKWFNRIYLACEFKLWNCIIKKLVDPGRIPSVKKLLKIVCMTRIILHITLSTSDYIAMAKHTLV